MRRNVAPDPFAEARRASAKAAREEVRAERVSTRRWRSTRAVLGHGPRRARAGVAWPTSTPEPHVASSVAFGALFPFLVADAGRSRAGVYIGSDVLSGAPFMFDPFTAYASGAVTSPSMFLLGNVGARKSSLMKTLAMRAALLGRRSFIIDPKGEYEQVALAMGGQVLRLEPHGAHRLCPLAVGPGVHAANIGAVRGLVELVAGDTLTSVQSGLLAAAVASVTGYDPTDGAGTVEHSATLADITAAIHTPTDAMLSAVDLSPEEWRHAAQELGFVLRRITDPSTGDLAGMIDGASTITDDPSCLITVIDVSAVYAAREHSPLAFPLVLTAAIAWVHARILENRSPSYLMVDEAWAVLGNLSTARYLQSALKMSRQWGLATLLTMHRLSDLHIGGQGSELYGIVEGLLRDVGTTIIYRQPPGERPLLKALLALPDGQLDDVVLSPRFPAGRGLWRVGADVAVVQHVVSDWELPLLDTDQAMRG